MLKKLIIIIGLLFLTSCVTVNMKRAVVPVCRQSTVYTAISWSDLKGDRVRLVVGPDNTRPGLWHSQTQAFVDNKWVWLIQKGKMVEIGQQDYWFTPELYYTTNEFITNFIKIYN